jgi:DNA polymerase III subunit delta'
MALTGTDIRGHGNVIGPLQSAAANGKLATALLFRGPNGIGKKKVALSLAQDLLCEKGTPACGVCGSCLRAFKVQHEGLLLVSTEETNLKLEDIQPIFDFVRLKILGRARVIIIDDAHKLNIQAANRLLKTLEEPPPNTYFILITPQETALPITIRSRCQLVRFGPLDEKIQRELLDAPAWAYKASQGRMDLLKKLSQESSDDRKLAFAVFKGLLTGERNYVFPQFAEFAKEKERTLDIFSFFEQFVRDLSVQENKIHHDFETEYAQLPDYSTDQIEKIWNQITEIKKAIEMNADRTLNLENLWFNFRDISA